MSEGKGTPLFGDRGAWDTIHHPLKHAKDVTDGTPTIHVPMGTTSGQTIEWNGSEWILVSSILTSFSFVVSIDDLSDVDTSTVPPIDGQALIWNSSLLQWVPGFVSSSFSIHYSGISTQYLNGTGGWSIPAGSGGASTPAFYLDTVPGSPSSWDDEFPGSSIDGKWTVPLSSGANLGVTTTVEGSFLFFEPTTAGTSSTGKRMFGIRQNAPAGNFTVIAKIANDNLADDGRAGLIISRLTATAHATVFGTSPLASNNEIVAIGVTSYSESADSGAYDASCYIHIPSNSDMITWFKAIWNSGAGTLSFYYSRNGIFWTYFGVRSGLSQPERIGLAIYSNSSTVAADHRLAIDWFRVTEP